MYIVGVMEQGLHNGVVMLVDIMGNDHSSFKQSCLFI